MATFTAVKNRGGGRGALGGVLRYTQQDEKTLWEGLRLVSGWNCTAQSALSEMRLTKERYRKTDGRQYYHFVQSFAETDDLTPQEAHAIALELAQREFPSFEVLVATHIDTDHLHSHLIVNSVSFQDGRKLHQSAADLQAHRLASDEICAAHGLEILPPPQKQVKQKRMSSREYRSAAKGESWKFRLMDTIDQCMKYAETKDEFISLMESEGYQVRWTDSRKNICIHFLYLSEKRLSLKACIFGSKQMAFVYLAFFDDGTAFPYLPVLPRDFLFGADTLSSLVKEHAAGSNLYIRFGEQPPLAENQMDMIICLALVVVEGGHALHTVPPAELLCKVREYLLRLVLRIDFGQGDNQFPCFDTFALCAAALKLLLAFPCKVAPKGAIGGAVGGIEIFLPCMACNIRYSPFDIGQF
ncbi:hypothetical protein B5G40_14625 [Flavonifractor sp. An9]|nr:hypothetical protein B5G40_14625 [Flavonifractor sp. An9]